jgi:chromosome segregation ATPase
MEKKLTNIAEILPEGLDESTVEKIFTLVDSVINEQVESKVKLLEAKVNAFLRTKIDQLKEQAITELAEENEVFRNAKLFESVRTLMTLELSENDESNLVSEMKDQSSQLEEEVTVLSEQINKLVLENDKLQNTIKVLSNKVNLSEQKTRKLEKDRMKLVEEVRNLEASQDEPFVSSEKAVLISESERPISIREQVGNPFLSPEAMKLMPFSR